MKYCCQKIVSKSNQALDPNTNSQHIQGIKGHIRRHHGGIIKIQTLKKKPVSSTNLLYKEEKEREPRNLERLRNIIN